MELIGGARQITCFEAAHEAIDTILFGEQPTQYLKPPQIEALAEIRRTMSHPQKGTFTMGSVQLPEPLLDGVMVLTPYLLGHTRRTLVITPSLLFSRQVRASFSSDEDKGFFLRSGLVKPDKRGELGAQIFNIVPATALIQSPADLEEFGHFPLLVVAPGGAGKKAVSLEDLRSFTWVLGEIDLVIVMDPQQRFPPQDLAQIVAFFREQDNEEKTGRSLLFLLGQQEEEGGQEADGDNNNKRRRKQPRRLKGGKTGRGPAAIPCLYRWARAN